MTYKIKDKIKIIDNETNKTIVDNYIVNYKHYAPLKTERKVREYVELISFDNKYFFRVNGNKYRIEFSNNHSTIELNIPYNYKVALWKDYNNNEDASVFIENDINELDEEVKNLVYSLNTINGIRTTGSCSGHNERCLFVDLIFENYEAIIFLIHILYSYFRNEFILSTHPTLECDDKIIMRLSTTDKGKTAYINANKLYKIIKEFL